MLSKENPYETIPTRELMEMNSQIKNELNRRLVLKASLPEFLNNLSGKLGFDLRGKSRSTPKPLCRYSIFLYLREDMGLNVTEIGRAFRRDHSTVIHGLNTAKAYLKNEDALFVTWHEKMNQLILEEIAA